MFIYSDINIVSRQSERALYVDYFIINFDGEQKGRGSVRIAPDLSSIDFKLMGFYYGT